MIQQNIAGWTLLAGNKSTNQDGNVKLSEEIAASISEMRQERNAIIYGQNTNQTPREIYKSSQSKPADKKTPKKKTGQ